MYSRVNYTVVGIFVLVFGISMVLFGLWLGKYSMKEEYSVYRLEMTESIAGLSKDSNVKLHGVSVGRVSQIRINPQNIERVEIVLNIQKGIPIKEDMLASTQMLGVTGLLSIEIEDGTNEAKTLIPTANYIPLIKTKPSMLSSFKSSAEGIKDKVDRLLTKSDKLLSDKNIEKISSILDNFDKLLINSNKVASRAIVSLDEFQVSVDTINQNFTKITNDFGQMKTDFALIKDITIPTLDNMLKTSKNFNKITLKFGKTIRRGDYNLKKMLEPILVDMRILSNQINDISRELGQNPSDLIFKSRKKLRAPGE